MAERLDGLWLRRVLAASVFGLLVAAAGWAAPSEAAIRHSAPEKTFSGGAGCGTITDIAVHEASATMVVACSGEGAAIPTSIRKFDLNGAPVPFLSDASTVSGNRILEGPGSPTGTLGTQLAVDNSNANDGFIYVVAGGVGSNASEGIEVFAPSGEWVGTIAPAGTFAPAKVDIDVGPDGSIYTIHGALGHIYYVSKHNSLFEEVERIYTEVDGRWLRVTSSGAVWIRRTDKDATYALDRYEPDQFSKNLGVDFGATPAVLEAVKANPSPQFAGPLVSGSDLRGFDVDQSDDTLYVNRGSSIQAYSAGSDTEEPYASAPAFGVGVLVDSIAIAVTRDHRIYASKGGSVVKFGPGDILPDIRTLPPLVDDVGHTGAVVRATVELDGGGPITSCRIEYTPSESYADSDAGTVPCIPDPAVDPPASQFTTTTDVRAELTDLITGQTYKYRAVAGNAIGENRGIDRRVTPAHVLGVKTLPANVTDRSAVLRGALDPDNIPTEAYFEYGLTTEYGRTTASSEVGSAAGEIDINTELNDLPPGKTFHFRIVATNNSGTTLGEDRVFRTASPPDITGQRASEVDSSSALLSARIDPGGYETEYRFEYGTTPEYGQAIPIPDGRLDPGDGPVNVTQRISGLSPGVTYHFRVVAINQWGTRLSPNTTFDFAPPSCPNAHVRQQTGASYLPDCRAYELVSPGRAGAVQLWPSQEAWDQSSGRWALNTGRASAPSRFAFFASGGVVAGIDAPNSRLDAYVATRTSAGWETTLPGLTGSQIQTAARKECSELLDLCTDHDERTINGIGAENAPHLFDVSGKPLGQLPSNVRTVSNGRFFFGDQRMSGDFRYFLFSSTDPKFTPDAVEGGQGSAYMNDREAHTVELISRLANGADIPQDGINFKPIAFPAATPDASHVLMQTPAANGRQHLYLRVRGLVTMHLTPSGGVIPIGMTRDGAKVLFIANQQLTPMDTDEDDDLYQWTVDSQGFKLLSANGPSGGAAECNATWVSGCAVVPLQTERDHPQGRVSVPGLDDKLADESGDVLFYSPESLDPEKPGIPDQRNLYLSHNDAVHLVATLDPGTDIDRVQLSPDGRFAGLVTTSRLTSYDSRGFRQMYSYDAQTDELRCASCNPTGLPPTSDVLASQGGRFMADDGRVFFASKDSLVPRDTNNGIIDVYEYVDGRPQLISSGSGARDFTGGGQLITLYTIPEYVGLEAVSRDGRDVYFSTFETLVSGDENGSRVKFYNARTGGGFPTVPVLAPCAAADECHGPDSSPPTVQPLASSAELGDRGNMRPAKARKKSKNGRGKKKRRGSKKSRNRPPRLTPGAQDQNERRKAYR